MDAQVLQDDEDPGGSKVPGQHSRNEAKVWGRQRMARVSVSYPPFLTIGPHVGSKRSFGQVPAAVRAEVRAGQGTGGRMRSRDGGSEVLTDQEPKRLKIEPKLMPPAAGKSRGRPKGSKPQRAKQTMMPVGSSDINARGGFLGSISVPCKAKLDGEKTRGSGGSSRSLGGNRDQAPKRTLRFACPFYRNNYQQYQSCGSFDLFRIKDVKQHLERKHKKPPISCSRCHVAFDTAEGLTAHAEDASCDPRPEPETINESHMQKLKQKKYANRGKSPEEQWWDIWATVFPNLGGLRPSVYVGNAVEESTRQFRSFWDDTLRKRVLDEVKCKDRGAREDGRYEELFKIIETAMDTTFDEIGQPSAPTAATPGSPDDSSMSFQDHRERTTSGSPTASEPLVGPDYQDMACLAPPLDYSGFGDPANEDDADFPSEPSSAESSPMDWGFSEHTPGSVDLPTDFNPIGQDGIFSALHCGQYQVFHTGQLFSEHSEFPELEYAVNPELLASYLDDQPFGDLGDFGVPR